MELSYFIGGVVISGFLMAFFSGLEIAFISVNKLSVELKKKQGDYTGKVWTSFMEKPLVFVSTTLLVANILLVVYSILWAHVMQHVWMYWRVENVYLQVALTVIAATVCLLPVEGFFKAVFHIKGNVILGSYFITYVVSFIYSLFSSVALSLVKASEWILKFILNIKLSKKQEIFSKVDLKLFFQQMDSSIKTGKTEINNEIFSNILKLSETRIRNCMIPRKEIVAVEKSSSIAIIKNVFVETKLSKLVVYDHTIDNIQGYVHQLDLFKNPDNIESVLLPIPIVPESMNAAELIKKFSHERKSIGWVIDEFGGTSGIVTMEDLLEEIFGEINDEYDVGEELVDQQIAPNEFIFSGRLRLGYLSQKYELKFDTDEEVETLSGFIINRHESIPSQKARIIIDNYQFDILTVSDTRIETVKLRVLR